MAMLFDWKCTQCAHVFEELILSNEPDPTCPLCNGKAEKEIFCNNPTATYSPKYAEIHMKAVNMRQKIQGKVPWRKNSYSQTGNE